MFSTGVTAVCAEKDFYTLEGSENPYLWEKTYANGIEPIMGELLPKIISFGSPLVQDGASVICDTEKVDLAFTLVMQLLRGKASREYERMLYAERLPKTIDLVKDKYKLTAERRNELMRKFAEDDAYFKLAVMKLTLNKDRILKYVDIILERNFVFYRILGDAEFISSDNPVMFINNTTGNARVFSNGLHQTSTDVYYPLSPKMILLASHPNARFGTYSELDCKLFDLYATDETKFISTINRKQIEQCYRQAYARSKDILCNLIA